MPPAVVWRISDSSASTTYQRHLIPKVAELCAQSEKRIERVALVIDAREGRFLDALFEILVDLRREGNQVRMVFLDASDEVLVRRFSESRRPHPMAPGGSAPRRDPRGAGPPRRSQGQGGPGHRYLRLHGS